MNLEARIYKQINLEEKAAAKRDRKASKLHDAGRFIQAQAAWGTANRHRSRAEVLRLVLKGNSHDS